MKKIDAAELLKGLVSIPSLSGGEQDLARFITEKTRRWGLDAEMVGRNVVIRAGRDQGPRLLLNSHLDTVAPVAAWSHDPFQPVETDGRISGLGANDAKGCVTAMLTAVAGIEDTAVGGQIVLALTVDEEIGGGGEGLERLIDHLGPLDAAVIGEPTKLDICCAQKGLLILEVETRGTARHAAHAHRLPGANAITEAARAITALDGFSPGDEHPLLGRVTSHVTTVEGGTRRNVIPDRCVFCLDIRTIDDEEASAIVAEVETLTGAEVRIRSDRLKSLSTDPNSSIALAARRARPEARVIGSATLSDAVWTRHLPTIKVGPGRTERSHTAGEYVTRTELEEGVDFYSKLISEFIDSTSH